MKRMGSCAINTPRQQTTASELPVWATSCQMPAQCQLQGGKEGEALKGPHACSIAWVGFQGRQRAGSPKLLAARGVWLFAAAARGKGARGLGGIEE